MQNAVNIYLPPGRHPVISAIAPELESRFAHILTEPLPENITALLQRLDAKFSAKPENLVAAGRSIKRAMLGDRDSIMKKIMPMVFAAAVAAAPITVGVTNAHAEDGAIAAGVAGGLLGGMLLGSALAQPHYYAPPPPPPVYYEAEPVYASHCYWTRGEPYWDDWSGRWHRPRVRVCE